MQHASKRWQKCRILCRVWHETEQAGDSAVKMCCDRLPVIKWGAYLHIGTRCFPFRIRRRCSMLRDTEEENLDQDNDSA